MEIEERSSGRSKVLISFAAAAAIATVVMGVLGVISFILQLTEAGPPDSREIRELITAEAVAAFEHDIDKAVELFAPDAVVRDGQAEIGKALGIVPTDVQSTWVGLGEIRDRYRHLPEFRKLDHVDVTVIFEEDGQAARAIASTSGEIVNEDGTTDTISSIDGEMWRFQKIDGNWKIASFTFNAP